MSETTQPQTKALKPIDEVKRGIQLMEGQFKMVLPPHVPVAKFMRIVNTAIGTTPSLMKCDRQSIFSSALKAAQDGLLPDGREAALVPFGDKAMYMPMLQGILKKIRNSGELATILAESVYENDQFAYWIDAEGQHIDHKPLMFGERGEWLGVYAFAKTKDGAVYIEVMTKSQVEQVKKSSRTANNGPWVSWPEEMAKKSVIRRLAKRLPSSTDLENTLAADNELYDFDKPDAPASMEDAPKEKPARRSRLAEKLEKHKSEERPVEPFEPHPNSPLRVEPKYDGNQEVIQDPPPPVNSNQEIPI